MALPFVSTLSGETAEQELHLQHHVTPFKISVLESRGDERLETSAFKRGVNPRRPPRPREPGAEERIRC